MDTRLAYLVKLFLRAMIPQSRGPPLDTNDLNSTNRLLRVIIALLLRGKDELNPSLKRQIEILADLNNVFASMNSVR